MKIALVSPYDFAYPGGVVYHVTHLYKSLTAMGHEVKIIAPASSPVMEFGEGFFEAGKPRPVPTSGSISRILIFPWQSSQVKRLLKEEKFDIIHLHEPLMPMLCTTVLRNSNTVNIGTFHAAAGRPGYNLGWPFTRRILRKWFQRLDGRIAVSQAALNFVSKYFPSDYAIIPNGVDLTRFHPGILPVERFLDGKTNIVFVGRLEARKGVEYLLKAFRLVKRVTPESRLIIVGPGTRLRNEYEKYVARWRLPDVVFTGFVPLEDLPSYYQTADIFCAPSTQSESFGLILLEAMAVGKPVVASNLEGYAALLTHGAEGLLVPPRNSRELGRALIKLINSPALRQEMGSRGRNTALRYGWENITRQVYDYYLEVLRGGSPEGLDKNRLLAPAGSLDRR